MTNMAKSRGKDQNVKAKGIISSKEKKMLMPDRERTKSVLLPPLRPILCSWCTKRPSKPATMTDETKAMKRRKAERPFEMIPILAVLSGVLNVGACYSSLM